MLTIEINSFTENVIVTRPAFALCDVDFIVEVGVTDRQLLRINSNYRTFFTISSPDSMDAATPSRDESSGRIEVRLFTIFIVHLLNFKEVFPIAPPVIVKLRPVSCNHPF